MRYFPIKYFFEYPISNKEYPKIKAKEKTILILFKNIE